MEIQSCFISFIASEKLDHIDNSKLVEYAYNTNNSDNTGVVKSNANGWQSDTITEYDEEISKLVDSILEISLALKDDLDFKKEALPYITNIWININKGGSFNRPHIHPDCTFAGVYYVKTSGKDGNIVFNHPSKLPQYHLLEEHIEEYNALTSSTMSMPPEENKLYIFPAWLEHYVESNLTDEERISIAFNVGLQLQ